MSYDGLATIIEDYYDIMRFILSTTEDGGAYVNPSLELKKQRSSPVHGYVE
jgi:hypothetical protein